MDLISFVRPFICLNQTTKVHTLRSIQYYTSQN